MVIHAVTSNFLPQPMFKKANLGFHIARDNILIYWALLTLQTI